MSEPHERLSTLRDQHRRSLEEFEAALRVATEELLAIILPSLDPEAVERATSVTGVSGIESGRQAETEREECRKEIEAIEREPLYRERDALLCPDTGELGGALRQLKQHRQALEPVLRSCLGNPRFLKLLESGYGTPEYGRPFWRLAYYLDRKAAREIEQECGGKPWEMIRKDVLAAMEASALLEERIKALQKRARRIEELVERRSRLLSRVRRLEQIWLDTARWRIRRALEGDPDGLLRALGQVEGWREPATRWRVRLQLVEEARALKEEYLIEAQHCLDLDRTGQALRLLDEFETRLDRLSRFCGDEGVAPQVDWHALFYG